MNTVYLFLGIYLIVCSNLNYAQVDHNSDEIQKIIGGEIASPTEFPWVVELVYGNGHVCGGSLIAPQWVVSAGHCVQEIPDFVNPPDKIRINPYNTLSPQQGTQIIAVEEIFIYPGYDMTITTYAPDVCLIKLAAPVTDPTLISILTEQSDLSLIETGDPCSVLGWGAVDITATQSDVMKIANIEIIDQDFCSNAYGFSNTSLEYSHTIYAGYTNGQQQQGAGAGDSGGPLFVMKDNIPLLIGVVSGGMENVTTEEYPGRYTKLYTVKDWINSTINADAAITELESSSFVSFYLENKLIIESRIYMTSSTDYKLFDMKGSIIQAGNIHLTPGKNSFSIDKSIQTGVYFIELSNQGKVYRNKLYIY